MSIERASGYVLHTRPFRDTSLLVDGFTAEQGRVSLNAKGAKRNKSPWRGLLQPFQRLQWEWFGKGDLKTLKLAEPDGPPILLKGDALISGFYLNEILTRLLIRYDPHPELYQHYELTLQRLLEPPLEIPLREFELDLLQQIGYGIDFQQDAQGDPLQPQQHYRLDEQRGWLPVAEGLAQSSPGPSFKGEWLQAIAQRQWQQAEVLKHAKRLTRLALRPHLGDKPLVSRSYFQQHSGQ